MALAPADLALRAQLIPRMTVEPRDTLEAVGRAWWLDLVVGVVSVLVGVLTLAWPGRTVAVVAVLIGLELLVAGVLGLIAAFGQRDEHRVWTSVAGLGAIVVGILCLKDVFQTVQTLALIVGILWVVQGVAEFFLGVAGRAANRALTIAIGIFGVVAGVVVLTYPIDSVLVLAVVFGAWLTVAGVLRILAALSVRRYVQAGSSEGRRTATASTS